MTQWSISAEYCTCNPKFATRIVLNRPDPAAVLASGRTAISLTAWMADPGSSYPNAELWIDSRHVDGRTEDLDYFQSRSDGFERVRWVGAARLSPGRHVMVVGVRPDLEAREWV